MSGRLEDDSLSQADQGPTIFYLILEAVPRCESSRPNGTGGAFVGCWIDRPTQAEAERVARQIIRQAGLEPGRLSEINTVNRSTLQGNQDGLLYYEQALVDKELLVVYRYPPQDALGKDG